MADWKRREEVIGKDVIDGDAKKLGVTKDLAWSSDGRMALVIESNDEEEFFLSFSEIERIGDVVFVKAKSALAAAPSIICPVCNTRTSRKRSSAPSAGTLEVKERKRSQPQTE